MGELCEDGMSTNGRLSSRSKPNTCMARATTSSILTYTTTFLTIYALFGDDMRLLFTEKKNDWIFNVCTVGAMVVFGLETMIFVAGQPGYFGGFFFWLDATSTITLVLDITHVAEYFFGDRVSHQTNVESSSNSGDSEAMKAGRIGRIGTKAGRVVRLIRVLRLIRLVLAKNSGPALPPVHNYWSDFDEDPPTAQESAVSKKLSDMTTRRVVMLVLVIMLCLPLFQSDVYGENLSTSAAYGLDIIFQRWCSDMARFRPWESHARRDEYMLSTERQLYEDDFRTFMYYHNWFCDPMDANTERFNPMTSNAHLFFMGIGPPDAAGAEFFLPSPRDPPRYDWNERWAGEDWQYYQCPLPEDIQRRLTWNQTRLCVGDTVRGISMATVGNRWGAAECPGDIRWQERTVEVPVLTNENSCDGAHMLFVFDRRSGSKLEAALNSGRTIFICLLLGLGAMGFSRDANSLVLMPIERMISKLEKIGSAPHLAMTISDAEHLNALREANDKLNMRRRTESIHGIRLVVHMIRLCVCRNKKDQGDEPEPMETAVLEKTIIKIGALLAMGFGNTGAPTLEEIMKGSPTKCMSAMKPGRKVEGIFGFCEVRNFLDATDLLAKDVTRLVNAVAAVVHQCTTMHHGSPIPSLGETFVLVWLTSDKPRDLQRRIVDLSALALARIVAKIARSPMLAKYKSHPRLVRRHPNYRVRLGFGLHSGSAIEGVFGSEFKLDVLYVTPVIAAARQFCVATVEYGCSIILTDKVHEAMSTGMAEQCRLIDRVVERASSKDIYRVYTIDLEDGSLDADPEQIHTKPAKWSRLEEQLDAQTSKHEMWSGRFDVANAFINDPDICLMRQKSTAEFRCRFHMGYLNYEAGEWRSAMVYLEATRCLLGKEDGPSKVLLRYMQQFPQRPESWPGYRVLCG